MRYYLVAGHQIERLRELIAEYDREEKSPSPRTARVALVGAKLAGCAAALVELAEPIVESAPADETDAMRLAGESC